MSYKHYYTFNEKENNGYEPCDILLQHYDSDEWRSIVIRADELKPWNICIALNSAYEAGKRDAMRNLRLMIGVEK
jgi:hypothetical protein